LPYDHAVNQLKVLLYYYSRAAVGCVINKGPLQLVCLLVAPYDHAVNQLKVQLPLSLGHPRAFAGATA